MSAGEFLVQVGGFDAGRLAADAPSVNDPDGDGLSNDFEWVLRSDPQQADTDGDGFSDLEEFARGSSVFWSGSVPLPGEFASRMTVRRGNGFVHVLMATYSLHGEFDDYASSIGLMINGQLVSIPPSYVTNRAEIATLPTSNGSAVQVIQLPIRDQLVYGTGALTIFGTVARASTGAVIAADVADLKSDATSIFLRTQIKDRPSQRSDLRLHAGAMGGSIYVPLPPPGQVPSTWNAGLICRQVSSVVGVSGGVITREVVAGECVEAFDSYCKSDCAQSVGTVEQSVDPLSLIGG